MRGRKLLHLLWIIPLLVILGAGGYLYYRYTKFQKPYFSDIETNFLVPHDLSSADISHVFKIVNPNDIRLHVDSVRYEVYLDGEKYGEGKRTESFTIRPNDTTPVKLAYDFDLPRFLNQYEKTGKDSAVHKFVFDFYADIWKFSSVHIPYTYEKNSAVFKRPEIKVGEVRLKEIGLNESLIQAEVLLHNPSDKFYEAYSLAYTMKIDDTEIAKGGIAKDQILHREGSAVLSLPIKLGISEVLKEDPLKKGFRDKDYTLSIHIELKPPPHKNVPVYDFDIVRTGQVSDLLKEYKKQREQKKEEKKKAR